MLNMSYQYNSRQTMPPVGSRKRKEKETTGQNGQASEPGSSNRILAGYLANEFLNKGTLFGEKFNPDRTETDELKKSKHESYAEVASILKSGEAHIPGIVNPTQLGRWIKM